MRQYQIREWKSQYEFRKSLFWTMESEMELADKYFNFSNPFIKIKNK